MAKPTTSGRKTPTKPRKPAAKKTTTAQSSKVSKPPAETKAATAKSAVAMAEKPAPAKKPAVTSAAKVPPVEKNVTPEKPPETFPVAASDTQKTNRFVPLLLGGLLAGGLGYGASYFTQPTQDFALAERVTEQGSRIAALQDEIATIPRIDLRPLETAQAKVAALMEALEERLAIVERQPSADGTLQGTAIAAYQAELDALRQQMETMAENAMGQLETARAEAAAIEENAAAAARRFAGRAALARVEGALETGAPLGAALADLEAAMQQPAPDALIAVQSGVPTLSALQDEFPDAARNALITARREGVSGEETSGFGAFLRNQFDVRSVEARDGDDADAILSRAEAAVRAGRISDALAEIDTLPEVARAELTEWYAMAEARVDALAAADALSTSLNVN